MAPPTPSALAARAGLGRNPGPAGCASSGINGDAGVGNVERLLPHDVQCGRDAELHGGTENVYRLYRLTSTAPARHIQAIGILLSADVQSRADADLHGRHKASHALCE